MKKKKLINLSLFIPLLILNIISIFNMINAKLISDTYNYAFYKQLLWILLGYLIIYLGNKLKINKKLFKYAFIIYFLSITFLILVLFLGKEINGARCWLNIFGFSFQPSELVKISLTLVLINIYDKSKITTLKDEFILIIKYLILTIIPSILVFLEPDTGAIINYLIILIVVLLYSKLNKWWYISFIIIVILLISTFIYLYFFLSDTLINILGTSIFYRIDRLINFANGNSYQLENALITMGASSFFGVGINKILLYIPEGPTDFIFSFSIGNYGIFSAILIIISYLTINIFLIYKSHYLKNNNYKIFIYAYLSIFIFHQIYNIFMNIGLLPIMGIPLPFLSYGGSNTLINYIFISIIISLFNKS